MDDLERPRRNASGDTTSTTSSGGLGAADETAQDDAAAQEDADIAMLLQLAHEADAQAAPTASDMAYGDPQAGAGGQTSTGQTTTTSTGGQTATGTATGGGATTTTTAGAGASAGTGAGTGSGSSSGQPKPKPRHHSSHDGGFTGFGAEFQPYTYTDPHENHAKLDPEVRRLGVQHTRLFVPFQAVETGLLGKAGTDYLQKNLDKLTTESQANPSDQALKKRLEQAQQDYAQAVSYTTSFLKTLELAGKQTTINLTFCGGTAHPEMIDRFTECVRYLVGQGFQNLQLTLENEPNGPDQSDGFRGRFNKGVQNHDKKMENEAVGEYVASYQRLDADLRDKNAGNVRDQVTVVGGDMVSHHLAEFWQTITRLGLNKYVDAYSFHIYWGADKSIYKAIQQLVDIRKLGSHVAPGKSLQITEFGQERFATKAERAKDPSHKGAHAVEKGTEPAFEQGMFALSAVGIGFTGVVKWDAFYGGEHHKGDGKGDPGQFYMIDQQNNTDAMYRLMRMFTHATEPGWIVRGAEHSDAGAQATFHSPDGKGGAILAMNKGGGSISTAELPRHEKLHITTWNGNGKGGLATHTAPAGSHPSVAIPPNGAVAISTKPI